MAFEKIIGTTDGEDVGRNVVKISGGGYAVAGKKEIGNDIQVYLLKTDADGATVWEKTYGASNENDAYSVIQTADGGFAILGLDYATGTMLIKTDASGNLSWTKDVAPGIRCFAFVNTPDDGYAMAGENLDGLDYYINLIRTNSSGDTLWTRRFGDPGEINIPYALVRSSDGGFVLTGETTSPPSTGENDIFLIKTDANGNLLWDKRFGTPDLIEQGYALQQTNDGGFLVGGTVIDALFGNSNAWLLKTNTVGDTLWTKQYDLSEPLLFNQIESIALSADGGYALCGWAGNLTGDVFGYLIKTDESGNAMLTRKYYGAGVCTLRAAVQADDGEIVATGFTQPSLAAKPDIYVIKTSGLVPANEPVNNPDIVISPNPAANNQYWQVSIAGQENQIRHWTLSAAEGKTLWELTTAADRIGVPVPATGSAFVLTVQSETVGVKSRILLSVD